MKIRTFPHAFLFLLCVWLIAEYFIFGKFSVFFTSDNMELIVPRLLAAQGLAEQNPLWDALSAAGSDRKTYLFPGQVDRFIFDTFPVWFAHSLRVSSPIIVAVLSIYALGRRTFGFGPGAAIFAAAAFSQTLSALLVEGTPGYMPGVLLALTYLLDQKSDPKRWILALFAIYFVAQTGFISRLIPYASVLIVAWFVFADPRKGYRDWGRCRKTRRNLQPYHQLQHQRRTRKPYSGSRLRAVQMRRCLCRYVRTCETSSLIS
jgi:hypothetical protein